MFCEYCGQKISTSAKFCSKCGKNQDEVSVHDSQNSQVSQSNSQEISTHLLMYRKFQESFCPSCGYSGVMGVRPNPFLFPAYVLALIVIAVVAFSGTPSWVMLVIGLSFGAVIALTLRGSAICPNCEVLSRSGK